MTTELVSAVWLCVVSGAAPRVLLPESCVCLLPSPVALCTCLGSVRIESVVPRAECWEEKVRLK